MNLLLLLYYLWKIHFLSSKLGEIYLFFFSFLSIKDYVLLGLIISLLQAKVSKKNLIQ